MPRSAASEPRLPACFVISPIADRSNSDRAFLRWKADYLLEEVIRPACRKVGLSALRMDRHDHNRWIPEEMIGRLARDPMAVAIVEALDQNVPGDRSDTSANANVVYEIGLRHAWCRPVVIMSPEDPKWLPFDLRDLVPVRYDPLRRKSPTSRSGVRWKQRDVLRVRKDLEARIRQVQTQDGTSGRFATALDSRCQAFGLELICGLKREVLEALERFLSRFTLDHLNDYDLTSNPQEAGPRLARLIQLPIQDYYSDILAFRRIAQSRLASVHGTLAILELCKIMESAAGGLASLRNRLATGRELSTDDIREEISRLQQQVRHCLLLLPR